MKKIKNKIELETLEKPIEFYSLQIKKDSNFNQMNKCQFCNKRKAQTKMIIDKETLTELNICLDCLS